MARRRTLYLPLMIAAAVSLACVAAIATLLAVSREGEATFPSKNGRIAYASTTRSMQDLGSIYTIDPGGGGKSEVPSTAAAFGSAPYYSPDGERIAYAEFDRHDLRFGAKDTEIYTIKPDGGGKRKVTTGGPPSYSPDGKTIVYDAGSDRNDNEIYTIDAGGGDKIRLTHNDEDEILPDYSPDGERIAYAGFAGLNVDLAESDIYTIEASGGGKIQVTDTDGEP